MEWNVVVTVQEGGYQKARRLLQRFGEVGKTDFFNLLVMRVPDHRQFMEELREEVRDPEGIHPLASVIPVVLSFAFQTPQEFEEKARQAVLAWLSALEG